VAKTITAAVSNPQVTVNDTQHNSAVRQTLNVAGVQPTECAINEHLEPTAPATCRRLNVLAYVLHWPIATRAPFTVAEKMFPILLSNLANAPGAYKLLDATDATTILESVVPVWRLHQE
jgi:hypothetical protein